jgi:hypothetical protein
LEYTIILLKRKSGGIDEIEFDEIPQLLVCVDDHHYWIEGAGD